MKRAVSEVPRFKGGGGLDGWAGALVDKKKKNTSDPPELTLFVLRQWGDTWPYRRAIGVTRRATFVRRIVWPMRFIVADTRQISAGALLNKTVNVLETYLPALSVFDAYMLT